jgi:hypothetical protein
MKKELIKKIILSGICLCILMSVPLNEGKTPVPQMNTPKHLAHDPLDLIVTNTHDNSISFFPGNGYGEFGVRRDSPAGLAPSGVAAADFNKDGNIDVAAADNNGSAVCILLGDGIGHFSAPQLYPVGGYPNDIAIADFNQDTNMDIAVCNQNDSTVSILYGNGTGGFGGRHDYEVGTGPSSIVSADFDKDGYLDIAVTNAYAGTLGILLGQAGGFGSCSFYPTASEFNSGPQSLAIGDFNNDSNIEIVVTNHESNSVSMLLGDGAGGFSILFIYDLGAGSAPYGIVAGDFNEDRNLDVAVTNQKANTISVLFGDGTGYLTNRQNFPVSASPKGIIAASFTGDDDLDLAVANHDSGCVTVLFGDGTGSFGEPVNLTVQRGPTSLVAAKFRTDTTLPVVQITKPVNGIYTMNMRILPFPKPLIFGKIDIQVNATDSESGISYVQFYIGITLMNTTTTVPYHWTWSKLAFFKHTITVIAYDNADNSGQAQVNVSKFF